MGSLLHFAGNTIGSFLGRGGISASGFLGQRTQEPETQSIFLQ